MGLLYIIHSLLSLKFRSTLAKIANIYIHNSFFNRYALYLFGTLFLPKKNPRRARRRASTRGLKLSNHLPQISGQAHGSDPTFSNFSQIFELFMTIWDVPKINPNLILLTFFHKFSKTQFAPKMTISMIWSRRSVLPSQNHDAHLLHVDKKHRFS